MKMADNNGRIDLPRREPKTRARDERKVAIGRRIREARDNANMSQHNLALLLGVTAGAICQWETGRTIPKSEHLILLPSLLSVARDWLVGLWKGNSN
jgi:transcriptional regulator with XRE-family HTH domain